MALLYLRISFYRVLDTVTHLSHFCDATFDVMMALGGGIVPRGILLVFDSLDYGKVFI